MTIEKEKVSSRIRIAPTLKDDLKSLAAARHMTLQQLTGQVLANFVKVRRELLQAAAEGNGEQGED